MNRVKLPKSFLAVNLSESHTFHKKEELEHAEGDSTMAEVLNSENESGDAKAEDVADATNQEIADPALASLQSGDDLDVTDAVEKSHGEPVWSVIGEMGNGV